jgi:hypothetical protein
MAAAADCFCFLSEAGGRQPLTVALESVSSWRSLIYLIRVGDRSIDRSIDLFKKSDEARRVSSLFHIP